MKSSGARMAGCCPVICMSTRRSGVLDQRLPEGDYETLAGLLMQQFGRLPAVGDTIEIALPLDITGGRAVKPKLLVGHGQDT